MKLIRGLATKKVRQEEGLFVAEGDKLVKEILGGTDKGKQKYRVHSLYATTDWIEENGEKLSSSFEDSIELANANIMSYLNRMYKLFTTDELKKELAHQKLESSKWVKGTPRQEQPDSVRNAEMYIYPIEEALKEKRI